MYRLSPNQPENSENIIILKPLKEPQSPSFKPFQLNTIPHSSSLKFVITHENNDKNFLEKKKNRKISSIFFKNDSKNGRWSKEEHNRFIDAIILYGNDWKKVQKHVATRTSTQARSHAQKFLMKLRNSEIFKNIDLSISWTKAVNLIKKKFNEKDLDNVLKSISSNFPNEINKINNNIENNFNKKKRYDINIIKKNEINDDTELNSNFEEEHKDNRNIKE